ncbi:MAG: TolC family protein [Rikenellaceae bacterium]|nr:TolC family protein [Rikenellaceae bacterium]
MKRLSLLTLAIAWSINCSAQISLNEYRHRVEEYSHSLAATRWAIDGAEADLRRARIGYLPRLDAAGDFYVNFRSQRTSDGSFIRPYSFGISPVISARLYDGGATRAAVGVASANVDIARATEEFTALEVRYAADYAYWNLLATTHLSLARDYYTRIVRSLREVVQARFDDGYTGRGDLLMVETQLSDAIYNQTVAQQTAIKALHNFNTLMGEATSTKWSPTDSLSVAPPKPQRVPIDTVMARRPDVWSAIRSVDRAEWGVSAARAGYNPSIAMSVSASYATVNPNIRTRMQLDGGAGVSLNIPIFAWGERRQAVRSARAVVVQSELALSELLDQVRREEADAWSDVEKTLDEVRQCEASLDIATENLSLSTFSYTEGQIAILDVLSAQLSWIQLFTNAISARMAYRNALATYARITGIPHNL